MTAQRLLLTVLLVLAFLAPGLTLAGPTGAQEIGRASEFDSTKASDRSRAQARGTHDADTAIPLAVEDALTSSWSPLVDGNELNDGPHALVFDDTGRALYAAGRFTSAGGVSATHIARWDVMLGTWSPLGGGLYGDYPLFPVALALDDTGATVCAGGNFTMAGAVRANHIACWDQATASWSALGDGMNDRVLALAWDSAGSALYAGGEFTTAGGVSANFIAKWDGAAWSPLGRGTDFPVYALALDDAGNLYAGGGGWYNMSGESPTNHIAKWDGENWSSLGSVEGTVRALAWDSARSMLYAGGWFTTVDGISANHIAKWNGAAWSPLGSGLRSEGVAALAVDSSRSRVYVAGWFTRAGGVSAGRTAMWDASTSSWSALGSGMNFSVNTLALDGDGQTLYAGGEFTTAGGISTNYIARWRPDVIAPIEQPSAGASVSGAVTLTGFAIDLTSPSGTGIDGVRVYLDGPSGAGALIGQATYGVSRPDIAALYGARFDPSGWELAWDTAGLAPGVHRLHLYAHRTTDDGWSGMDPHLVVVPGGATVWLPVVSKR